jgi:hypothetical protein
MAAALQLHSHRMTSSHPMTKIPALPVQPMPEASPVYRNTRHYSIFDPDQGHTFHIDNNFYKHSNSPGWLIVHSSTMHSMHGYSHLIASQLQKCHRGIFNVYPRQKFKYSPGDSGSPGE